MNGLFEKADIIRGLIRLHGLTINTDSSIELVNNYWDNDSEVMLYNLEMDSD
jgi:hypothetical protein